MSTHRDRKRPKASFGNQGPGNEKHRLGKVNWLRAAVLGADDGIVSTASILLGVAATSATHGQVMTAGVAGLVAGAASMAAGEYVSVSSQRDLEQADIAVEAGELEANPKGELRELASIYESRGLSPTLAMQVATELSRGDRLAQHLRDELGIDPATLARPLQAAASSAMSFASAAALPLLAMILLPRAAEIPGIVVSSLLSLAILGSLGAYVSGASVWRGTLRVVAGGGLAMAVTSAIGHFFRVPGA